MQLFSEDELECSLYGWLYRLSRDGVDRRTSGTVAVDRGTGLPISANDLTSYGASKCGEAVAFEFRIAPKAFAIGFAGLTHTAAERWTREEAFWVNTTEVRIKQLLLRGAEKMHFDVHPINPWDGTPVQFGIDGFPYDCTIKPEGLRYAKELVRSTKYERGPVSILNGAPADVIQNAPEYAQSAYREEK